MARVVLRTVAAAMTIVASTPLPLHAAEWFRTFGALAADRLLSVDIASDGSYILAGTTRAPGGSNADGWLVKLSPAGAVQWQKAYDAGAEEYFSSVHVTSDGGFVMTGATHSATSHAAWVVKVDSSGQPQWQRKYEPVYGGVGNSIRETLDPGGAASGYVLAGGLWHQPAGNVLGFDAWVVRLDMQGNVVWQRSYGGGNADQAHSVRQTSDGGYIVAGATEVGGTTDLHWDGWLLKLDGDGAAQWQRRFGETGWDQIFSVHQLASGDYIASGMSQENQQRRAYVVRTDANGNTRWQQVYGHVYLEMGRGGEPTSDGGYIVFGDQADHSTFPWRAWLLKLDGNGAIQWQRTYGTYSAVRALRQVTGGGYVFAGTMTTGIWVPDDAPVAKVDSSGGISGCARIGTANATAGVMPTPSTVTAATVNDTVVPSMSLQITVADTPTPPNSLCFFRANTAPQRPPFREGFQRCLAWPNEAGRGIPGRCPPPHNCYECTYTFSRSAPARQVAAHLRKAYSAAFPVLIAREERITPRFMTSHLEKAFTEAPMGPYYLPDVKRAVLQELRSAKTAKAALKESIAEALHALELDASVPALAPALLPAGAYSAADFAGVAWIGLKDVKRAGRATLRVEAGLPAETDGVFAPWPMVTYRFAFDGELGADGYADVSLYLGGLHLAAPLAELRVLQWDGNEYIDVTSGVDSTRGVIMARSNRLSSYIVGRPATPDR